jgi:endonuclease/exonuclease/phosphatase family metal-dependent hydrolase
MHRLRRLAPAALLAVVTAASACAPLNYTHPILPSTVVCCVDAPAAPESLRVVTFNIRFARRVGAAIEVLRTSPELAHADFVLLQEMDGPSTVRVARALGMNAVYYPAVRHPSSGRDFGNAILTPHRVLRHRKIRLPHAGRFGGTRRIAASAIVRVGGHDVAVTTFHLATPIENGPNQRRDQIDAIAAANASVAADLVIIGGDLNAPPLVKRMMARGYACPTRGHGATAAGGQALDHVFVRRPGRDDPSLDARDPAGVRPVDRATSDHDVVWTLIPLAPPAPAPGGPRRSGSP